jgi:predicted esterase
MIKKLPFLLFLCFLLCNQFIKAQEYTTITYYSNDTLQLDLDLFMPKNTTGKKLPLFIYVHGGGFSGGNRTWGYPACMYLTNNGFITATISYTLYMKNKSFSCDGILAEKVKAMQYGANQLWLATSYFLKNCDKYNIDTSKIFIAGSSAGAETVLHAAFWNYKTMNLYKNLLPDSFKYAGMVAGAGAIMDLNFITEKNKTPVLMFHGNSDILVPYANAAHHYCKPNTPGWLMFFGSYSIYNHLISLNGCTELVTFCGGGHEYSGWLFDKEPIYILNFLNDVIAGKKFQSHIIIPTGKKDEKSAVYKFCD